MRSCWGAGAVRCMRSTPAAARSPARPDPGGPQRPPSRFSLSADCAFTYPVYKLLLPRSLRTRDADRVETSCAVTDRSFPRRLDRAFEELLRLRLC